MSGPSILTRRCVLQGLVLTAGAASAGAGELLIGNAIARVVFDSREAASLGWRHGQMLPSIDMAQHESLWRELRAWVPDGRIAGLTRWSDHVLARSLLQERGLRVRVEAHRAGLYYWEMS